MFQVPSFPDLRFDSRKSHQNLNPSLLKVGTGRISFYSMILQHEIPLLCSTPLKWNVNQFHDFWGPTMKTRSNYLESDLHAIYLIHFPCFCQCLYIIFQCFGIWVPCIFLTLKCMVKWNLLIYTLRFRIPFTWLLEKKLLLKKKIPFQMTISHWN